MALKDDIINKAKEIIAEEFVVKDVNYIPDISDSKLTFGCTGLQFDATVLYVDIRGSTGTLNKHHKTTVARIHMVYFQAIVKIAKSLGGKVRSFNGDSLLVFFEGNSKESLNLAVKAGMQMTYVIDDVVNNQLSKYSEINFGIGIDYGKILCTKIGLGKDSNNQDLIWIGNPVNKATKISINGNSPNHIGISRIVYSNLEEDLKFHESTNMWVTWTLNYNGVDEDYYYTHYRWSI